MGRYLRCSCLRFEVRFDNLQRKKQWTEPSIINRYLLRLMEALDTAGTGVSYYA